MLAKLLSLIAQAKGATVAAVMVAGAATATVGATTPEVQDAFASLTSSVTNTFGGSTASRVARDCGENPGQAQVAVVMQRNAAEKLLREAYNTDHRALEDLKGGRDVDNKTVGEIVRSYDDQLRDTLNVALNKVASLTLGREGQVRKDETGSAKPSARPSESPKASGSPKPSCSPKPSASAKPSRSAKPSASPKPSETPRASGSGKPEDQGRSAVAERTTLDADIQAIVDQAIADMDALLASAQAEAALVPPPDRGKPSDRPGGKPSDNPGGKPSENPGNKPSGNPGGKPSPLPARP